jgi:hypothetical protein
MTTLAVRSAPGSSPAAGGRVRGLRQLLAGEDGLLHVAQLLITLPSAMPATGRWKLAALFCVRRRQALPDPRAAGRRVGSASTALILEMAGKISNIARKRPGTERHSADTLGSTFGFAPRYSAIAGRAPDCSTRRRSLVRAQYRPSKGPHLRAFCIRGSRPVLCAPHSGEPAGPTSVACVACPRIYSRAQTIGAADPSTGRSLLVCMECHEEGLPAGH